MTITYNKLVRDRIPEIIQSSGKKCSTEILSDEEYLKLVDRILYIHGKRKDIDPSAFGIGDLFPSGATPETAEALDPVVHGDELANDMVHYAIQFGADAKKVTEMYTPARRKYYKPGNPYFSLVSRIDHDTVLEAQVATNDDPTIIEFESLCCVDASDLIKRIGGDRKECILYLTALLRGP